MAATVWRVRAPSAKRLFEALAPYNDKLHEPFTMERARKLHQMMRACGSSTDVERVLQLANKWLEGHGVEALRDDGWSEYYLDIGLEYVNLGDTYDATVVYDTRRERFYATDWGSIVERQEKRFRDH